jgi:hypothetical protein
MADDVAGALGTSGPWSQRGADTHLRHARSRRLNAGDKGSWSYLTCSTARAKPVGLPAHPSNTSTHWSHRRWSPPSSTRGEHSQYVAGLEPGRALVGQALSPVLVTLGQQPVLAWRPRFTAP